MSKDYNLKEGENLGTKFKFLADLPGYSLVKDTNSIFQSISTDFSLIVGWNGVDEAIGKNDYDVPCEASKAAGLFVNVDEKVIKSKQSITAIEICNYASGVMAFLDQKKPLKNSQDIVVGIFSYGIDITKSFSRQHQLLEHSDSKFINKSNLPIQYILTPEASPLLLSIRQQECLALLVRGKTMKEIAFMLGISARTVEAHLEAIKHKLGCYNRSQLIEKAIDSGFLFHVPASLFGLNLLR